MKSIFKFFHQCLLSIILFFISAYKKCISPFLPCACRFEPTCSVYMQEAIKKHGVFKGGYMGIKRIMKCHPWGKHGYDPVPENNKMINKNL